MNEYQANTRREFLSDSGKLAVGVTAAAAALGANTATAADKPTRSGKKITPGSPSRAYSRAVRLDRTVYVAGCVGVDKQGNISGDFATQAKQTLENLKTAIEDSGSSMKNVMKCTCFLKEYADFAKFNEIYMKFFPANPPARSTVIIKDTVVPGATIEVDCVCYVE